MASKTAYECYTDEWKRTNPDLVVYLPREPSYDIEHVDHLLVDYTPGGDLLAIWTMCVSSQPRDDVVAYARSKDGGVTWSKPDWIDGPGPQPGQSSNFGFPVISRTGRIYCFYNKTTGVGQGRCNAVLRCKYSDDDGYTWIDGGVEIAYRRTKWDHPDPKVQPACIIWQKPIRDAKDRPIAPLTRLTAPFVRPISKEHGIWDHRCEFLRFDNIDDGPDPKDVQLTWLPDDDDLIWVPVPFEPEASQGYTNCAEPGPVLLPDGRLLTVLRTPFGQIWYTVSDDDGHTWREPEILRYFDGSDPVLNPEVACPIYEMQDGRYLLLLQNHDGYGYGGNGPMDKASRRPQFLAIGEYRQKAHQPIWFSPPQLLFDTQKVGVFPLYMVWLAMYASLTEREGKRILWYTDRKIFCLGRYITDEMLAPLTVPR